MRDDQSLWGMNEAGGGMNLRDLSKEQSDAAHEAARILCTCSPNRDEDRRKFREAKAKLESLLPASAEPGKIISQAVRWEMEVAIADVCAGMDERVWVASR